MEIIPRKWLKKPNRKGDGLLQAWLNSGEEEFPIPIETHNVILDDVTLDKEQDFEFFLEGDSDFAVYIDEKDHDKKEKICAIESFIPIGLFAKENKKESSAISFISGKIIDVCDDPTKLGFNKDDKVFRLSCLGYEFTCIIHKEEKIVCEIKEGIYLSGVFWIQGWPKGC